MAPTVTAEQVLAFRLAGQGLAARDGTPDDALGGWAVQDSPPGAAAAALAARAGDVPVGWLTAAVEDDRSAVALYNARTATAVVPAGEAAAYGTSMLPADDDGLKAVLGRAVPERDEGFAEPVELAVDAISSALDGTVLSRDDLHEALRGALPGELLPWCEPCGSHHARRGLLVMAALRGRLCLAGRAGRQPAFARTDQWVGWDAPERAEAGAELVRRYLHAFGPSTRQDFAAWAGLGTAHGRELWELVVHELAEVDAGGSRAWLLAADLERLEDPPPASGVRLLAAGDPLLTGRDRETLLADPALRKRLWAMIGGPGLVLAGGRPVALWRGRKKGRRLDVTAEAFGDVRRDELLAEARRVAPHRGCQEVSLEVAGASCPGRRPGCPGRTG